jgi:hypothetical protein
MSKEKKSLFDYLKSVDQFGTPITLTYRGEFKYQTIFGAFASLVCFVVLLSYAGTRLALLKIT